MYPLRIAQQEDNDYRKKREDQVIEIEIYLIMTIN